jgi:hypothetical protein
MTSSTLESDPVYDRFQLIANGPALFNAVVTALDLNIFDYLSHHPGASFEDIQELTGIGQHKLRILLLGLCASELVQKNGDGYSNHPVAESLLAADGPESWRHILISWQRLYYPAFYHMTAALRSGQNDCLSAHAGAEPTLYQRLAHEPELQGIFHSAMAAFTLQTMSGLIDNPEFGSVRHLFDVAGGNGTTAVNFVTRYPKARVTVFDLPSVIDLARDSLPADLAGQIELRPGDMFADEFPAGADSVLFSHVLDTVSEERARVLLAKGLDLIPSGGKVFIYGFNADDDENGGVLAARLSLYLNILATGEGMAWPVKDFTTWLTELGCTSVRSYPGLPFEHGLVVGVKG